MSEETTTTFGTLAWGQETDGRLGARERFALLREGLALQLGTWGEQARRAIGLSRRDVLAARDVPDVDTRFTEAARRLCADTSEPWLLNHCLRTYAFGSLLGVRDGLRYDAELLYAASLLHDLGLTKHFWAPPGVCFAVEGARVAQEQLRVRGMADARARIVADAIALHMNVRVGLESGPEAHLLSAGAGLDVVGLRVADLSPEALHGVVDRHPRLGFKKLFGAALSEQAAQTPRARAAFLCQRLQFQSRIRGAPFAE